MDISFLRERREEAQVPAALTVTALNEYIKTMFDRSAFLNAVTVRGEISNFKYHTSGHLYFTLKDEGGEIRAVMFRGSAQYLKFRPEDGMKVIVQGSVTVYPKNGSYQLYAASMQPDGIGALFLAYEQRKAKLAAEGLFDESRKKPLPPYPERIGVITSPTGAAVRDMIHVTGRRYPLAEITLYPALVQGESAEPSLIRALDYFERERCVDVIILGRGGGSIEDLWAFNGEALARRIASMSIPVISAVGHETDFTICDFVADLRAPTPSAAAEVAVPDIRELLLRIDALGQKGKDALLHRIERAEDRLALLSGKPCLQNGNGLYAPQKEKLERLAKSLTDAMVRRLEKGRADLAVLSEKAGALSPLSVLSRGYAVAESGGKVLRSVKETAVGDTVNIQISDGKITAEIKTIKKHPAKTAKSSRKTEDSES